MADLALIDDIVAEQRVALADSCGRPLRVLQVINGEHYAGAERVQDLLAGGLPEFGVEVVFAAVKPDQFPLRRKNQTARIYETPMRGKADVRPARVLAAIARREGCSLIHTHTVRTAIVGRLAAYAAGLPMVHHLHSPTSNDSTRRLHNVFNAIVERIGTFHIAAAIAVSQSLQNYGSRHGIPQSRIHVVHNGVPAHGPLRSRSTPQGVWTIGSVALFRPRKGLETLLEAIARLRRDGRNVRLRAIGRFETPEYEREISAQVARLGIADAVDWRGFCGDVGVEFAAMDLFALPSLFGEGLPMVVLEAMSYGVPVVSTRVEGIPEAIRDGVDGLIVAPGDPAALAHGIASFLQTEVDWQALRVAAHRRQAEHFSVRSMAEGTARVYRHVLSQTPARTAHPM